MKLTKLTHFRIFALLLSFSISSCKNEIVNKSSAEQEIRQMERLQIQGVLEQDSTIIRKILASGLIVNAPTNTVFDLNVVMDAFKQG